jgi:PAS domain S-box-containing protein
VADEERLWNAAIVESSDDAILSKDLNATITSWNAGAQRIFGYTAEEAVGRPITILIPPYLWDEEMMILEKLRAGERIDHYETIRVTKAGKKVNVSLCISPIGDPSGKIAGFSKIARDISERKRAERELADMKQRLIEAQEHERARIGRELHDDINQRLALLVAELEQLQDNPSEVQNRLQEVRKRVTEISSDVQALSHELHSTSLEYLGIVAATRSFCRGLAAKYEVSIEFRDDHVPMHLPKEISLCLFRVAQEALHNALKHSGVKQFVVEMIGAAKEVRLVVRDAGAGFDVEEAKGRGSLGLVSMKERINMVRGQFSIESRPGEGTKIVASVPLKAENEGSSAGTGLIRSKGVSAGFA